MASLLRCSHENKLLDRVETNWRGQLKRLHLTGAEQWDGIFAYARRIVGEDPPDPRYGIFALCEVNSVGQPRAPYLRLVHVNHAFPKKKGEDARFVWSYPAPHIQQETDIGLLYSTIGDYISAAWGLASQELNTKCLRIYLGSPSDNAFIKGFAKALNGRASQQGLVLKAKHAPGWLIMDWS